MILPVRSLPFFRRPTPKFALLWAFGLLILVATFLRPVLADDPPTLQFSTYLGGNGYEFGGDIAIDAAGNIYVIGTTGSTNFPASSPFGNQTTANGYRVYVTKFDPTGTTQLYSVFLGGGFARGIAVDADGAAYVVGSGEHMPMVSAIQSTYNGTGDAFIAKINPSGTALEFSTYLGGSGFDSANAVALDSSNNVYVVGYTRSNNFPLLNPYQDVFGGNVSDETIGDAFVAKINPTGSALVYSTYFGGNSNDSGYDIAADDSGNAYITGNTSSDNFPVINAYQSQHVTTCTQPIGFPSIVPCGDGFAAKLNASGAPIYSTYLGGNGLSDNGLGIAVDSAGSAYVTGFTDSTNFPTYHAYQSTRPGTGAAFLTKLSPDGLHLSYSTYLGGTTGASLTVGVAVDQAGYASVVGVTNTGDFPTVLPVQAARGGVANDRDLFAATFSTDGQSLMFSTYLGGSKFEGQFELWDPHIAFDDQGNIYLTSTTESSDFPLQNAFQNTPGGSPNVGQNYDAFVAKIALGTLPTPPEPTPDPTATPIPTSTPAPTETPIPTATTTPSLPDAQVGRNYFITDTPTLTWTAIGGAMRYHVQVSKNKLFTGTLDFEGETPAMQLSITTDSLPDGLYYWRVQAQKADGSWGSYSPVESFTVYAH